MKKTKGNKGYCNQFTINRANHKSSYTCITNYLIKDERLNATEKGIMLLILSNDDKKYVLNMSILKKQCNIGDDRFNTSKRNLINLGYLNKQRIQCGIHWIVNEIPNVKGNTGNLIKSENTPSDNTSNGNTPSDNTTFENTSCVNTSLINNKPSAETGEPVPPEEKEKTNEINTNATVWVENSEISSPSNGNDLELLIQESSTFKIIYESNSRQGSLSGIWTGLDITNYSNSYIAFLIASKFKNEPLPNDVDNNVMNLLHYMVKYSKEVKDSQLWTLFLKEVDNDINIIHKVF